MSSQLPVREILEFTDHACRVPPFQQSTVIDLPRTPDIHRILIIKWGGMGDVVVSTAIMQDIREAFPHAELHLNAMPPWHTLFSSDPRFSKVWCVDLRKRERGLSGYLRWCKQVIQNRYDLIIDLQTNDKSRLLLGMLKLLGKTPRYLLGNHPVFPYTIRQDRTLANSHSLHIMHQTLAAVGISAKTNRPVLYAKAEHQQAAKQLMDRHGLLQRPFAVLLCGSHAAGISKRWGASHYAELAQALHAQGMQHVVLIGGADDAEECGKVAAACPELVINLCGQTELLALPTLFAQARLIVGNDTGTAHLAASTMTPMLVICGPTDPRRVKPIGPQVRAIQAVLPCVNCYQKTCSHHSCMRGLSVGKVLPFLNQL